MASSGGSSEILGAGAAVSTTNSRIKLKRTPVILNIPRKPEVAHFKVLQWNVLADGLAQNGDFCRVPPACLEWEYRKPLLIQEILEANADIICLQELNHFDELREVLSGLGYGGAFREKRASPALKYEFPPDGMAVFYRRSRFRCPPEGQQGRSFCDDQTGREQSQGFLQILLYDTVVGRELLVVTTHLKAKDGAECEEVRFQQAEQLLRHVEETIGRLQGPQGQSHQDPKQAGEGEAGRSSGAPTSPASGERQEGHLDSPGLSTDNNNGSSSTNGNGALSAVNGGHASSSAAGADAAAAAAVSANGNGGTSASGSSGGGGVGVGGSGRGPPVRVPVVVTGDFNALPRSKTCEAFRRHPLGLLSLWEQRPLDATLSSWSGSDLDLPPGLAQPPSSANGSHPPASPQQPSPQAGSLSGAAPEPPSPPPPSQPSSSTAAAATTAAAPQPALPQAEFSTWKFRVKGESKRISDYIYFSGGAGLRPLLRWRMLTEEEIGPTALPCSAYASDHVSLCCEFEWDVDADLEWAPRAREADWGSG